MNKIAIGIPTLNEEDTISNTTRVIDSGMSSFFGASNCYIINADNNSADNTKVNFENTPTSCKKVYISSNGQQKGKGLNVLNFIKYCYKNNIEYAATIDSDISTIEADWVKKLFSPITKNGFDFVTPLYRRNRFEGSTTNHFAFPFIYTFFGTKIRQPIGGEFAFNRDYIDYLLSMQLPDTVREYGIDIFLTTHAVAGNFKVAEALLGRKFHKPSFPKIIPMFKQVFSSALQASLSYPFNTIEVSNNIGDNTICIDENNVFKHRDKVKELIEYSKDQLHKNQSLYKDLGLDDYSKLFARSKSERFISLNDWSEILSDFFSIFIKAEKSDPSLLSNLISPLFFLRTISFWFEIEDDLPLIIEKKLDDQAKLIRSMTLEKVSSK